MFNIFIIVNGLEQNILNISVWILNKNSFTSEFPLMTVHNEIDYYNSGHLSENYEILTRTRQIGKIIYCYG